MRVPDEVMLATRLMLGIADRAALAAWVDARVLAASAPDADLLELATPGRLTREELAARLLARLGTTTEQATLLQMVAVDALVDAGELSLEQGARYVGQELAPDGGPLAADAYALDDTLRFAQEGAYGHTKERLREDLHALAIAASALTPVCR